MNTAALLPSPSAAARPPCDAVADSCVGTAQLPQEGFALALVASLDADAEPVAQPQPALLAQAAQTPLPVALPEMPEMPGKSDDAETLEPLDPQSAFALAALGLLPMAVLPQAPAPVAPAPAGAAAVATAGPALPVGLAPLAAPAAAALTATPVEPRPAATAQAQPLPAAPLAVPQAEPAPDAAQDIATARAAVAAAAPNAAPTGATNGASNETAAETLHKTERAGAGTELPAVATPAVPPVRPAAAPAMTQPAVVLRGEATQWQQPLLQALGDRLQLQIAARSDRAVIRLEPAMLGQVEIAIRQQAGDLQVRIAATHDEVTRQIQQVGEQLRQSLVQRHGGEVSVQVAQPAGAGREAEPRGGAQQQAAHDDPQQARDEQQQQQQQRPGRGLNGGEAASFAADLAAAKA